MAQGYHAADGTAAPAPAMLQAFRDGSRIVDTGIYTS
jgi:hypothetical protein